MKQVLTKISFKVLWLVALLPYPYILAVGRWLGRMMYRFSGSRTLIARENLKRCFPQWSADEIEQHVRRNLESTGMGMMETAMLWFGPNKDWSSIVELENLEHLEQFTSKGQGVLLLSFHLTHLEIGGSLLGTKISLGAMYRRNEDSLIEAAMTEGRSKFVSPIPREATRDMVRHIKKGGTVWYAADQDYGRKQSVFVPFFKIPTATITATSRFVKLTKAPVVPMTQRRDLKRGKIIITLHPPIDITGTNPEQEAIIINRFLERYLQNGHVDDYLWVHRRFKTRPNETDPSFYPKKTWGRPVTPQRYKDIMESAYKTDLVEQGKHKGRPKKLYTNGSLIYFIYKDGLFDDLAEKTNIFIQQNQVEILDGIEYKYRGLKRKCSHEKAMLVYLENIKV